MFRKETALLFIALLQALTLLNTSIMEFHKRHTCDANIKIKYTQFSGKYFTMHANKDKKF